jgi:alpha-beta hydrolase superfamily lysophospholipase
MVEGGPKVADAAGSIHLPVLTILGGSDPVIDPEAARDLFDRLGAADKTLLIYPALRHEPLNEVGREKVIDDVVAWLDHRLSPEE